jgi:hypothetical protein
MWKSATLTLMVLAQFAVGQVTPHGDLRVACESCHETDSWRMKTEHTFKHETTGFLLAGKHKVIKCASCHQGLKFKEAKPNCTSCHTDVHRSELGASCLNCHTAVSWRIPDMMQKHQQTRFPLAGRHQTLLCQSCHVNAVQLQFVGTPTTCIGCHRSDYKTTKNPDHAMAQFSIDCAQCHNVTSMAWGGSFDHSLTSFPLMGAHRAAPCASCHQANVYKGLSVECVSCHRSDYEQTSNPNHTTANFPTVCQACHTSTSWNGATFDHNATRFPLTGTHVSTPCQSCHVNGNYQLTFTDCYQCHQAQFVQSSNPNHVVASFPHDCRPCHTTASWRPSIFDHDQRSFRIYTGKHRGEWTVCSDCHLNPMDFTVFTCLNCHEHRQSVVDPKHTNVTGYSYTSPACYNCHRGV